jgi:hypothetical protein
MRRAGAAEKHFSSDLPVGGLRRGVLGYWYTFNNTTKDKKMFEFSFIVTSSTDIGRLVQAHAVGNGYNCHLMAGTRLQSTSKADLQKCPKPGAWIEADVGAAGRTVQGIRVSFDEFELIMKFLGNRYERNADGRCTNFELFSFKTGAYVLPAMRWTLKKEHLTLKREDLKLKTER